jgi:hypothetical protein
MMYTILIRLYMLSPHFAVITPHFHSMARFRMLFTPIFIQWLVSASHHYACGSDSLGIIINLPTQMVLMNSLRNSISCRNALQGLTAVLSFVLVQELFVEQHPPDCYSHCLCIIDLKA